MLWKRKVVFGKSLAMRPQKLLYLACHAPSNVKNDLDPAVTYHNKASYNEDAIWVEHHQDIGTPVIMRGKAQVWLSPRRVWCPNSSAMGAPCTDLDRRRTED